MAGKSILKEIPIASIENFSIGNATNQEGATGCTVILAMNGAVTGVDIRGGAPASRESALLNPLAANNGVHAVLLCGGSAYGLDAAAGVMKYLEERQIGFQVGPLRVPIVCASCLFDLQVADHLARPDAEMGYAACVAAESSRAPGGSNATEKGGPARGNVGAGTGATVGKLLGAAGMMKAGLGVYAAQLGELKMGAVVAVNAMGDIYDYKTNERLAGLLDPRTGEPVDTEEAMFCLSGGEGGEISGSQGTNTTIGVIITNGAFSKTELTKIAGMAHNGYARSIRPVHTMADGDSIYAMSAGEVRADLNIAGTMASVVMAEAVKDAALLAKSAYGLKSAADIN